MMKSLFGGIRVHETLTNVVIPSFDSKLLNPVIFTSTKAKNDEYMDALLSDVIIGSSSPPLAYPPHYFNICTSHQVCREFNLFDGAVISNNPTLVAVTEMIKEVKESIGHVVHHSRLRVLSLGTGAGEEAGYEAKGYKWGITDYYNLSHAFDEDYTSLNSLISDTANDRMVELYSHLLLDKSNFLRIQVDTLSSSEANFANGTKANLMHLGETAQELLNQNLTSFDPKPCHYFGDSLKESVITEGKLMVPWVRLDGREWDELTLFLLGPSVDPSNCCC
ncbi:hypothetical protein NE237_005871 [Protea cynaroides]|uniref:PNPLA domain-containing protein n=1 Tax=Protea cynaroides TaxID=273540 RepID=A0A9Q0KL99_9MAGN|nr:hypothetical protein NE237_005871 [Protea cynaroides]